LAQDSRSMKQHIDTRIFWGLMTGSIAALLFAFGDLLLAEQGLFMQADSRPDEFAALVTSDHFRIWAIRGLFGVVLEMLAFLCLYLALRNGRSERLAFWALVLFLVHISTGQSLFAILYFIFPGIGEMHLQGLDQVIGLAHMKGDLLAFIVGGGIIWVLANILFAIAIWRDGTLPKASGVVILIGFLLIDAPSPIVQFIANLIWGGALLWIALAYRKHCLARSS
jgi:uncharacterized membrane protein YhaH (DUF805 family)